MVAHAFNPSTHSGGRGRRISEFEASLVYKSEFQDSQGYTEKPCLEKPKKKKKTPKGKKYEIENTYKLFLSEYWGLNPGVFLLLYPDIPELHPQAESTPTTGLERLSG
jgi:hypothetical protein